MSFFVLFNSWSFVYSIEYNVESQSPQWGIEYNKSASSTIVGGCWPLRSGIIQVIVHAMYTFLCTWRSNFAVYHSFKYTFPTYQFFKLTSRTTFWRLKLCDPPLLQVCAPYLAVPQAHSYYFKDYLPYQGLHLYSPSLMLIQVFLVHHHPEPPSRSLPSIVHYYGNRGTERGQLVVLARKGATSVSGFPRGHILLCV